MPDRLGAGELLRAARALYDDPHHGLSRTAQSAWQGGFRSGGEWMRTALGELRGIAPDGPSHEFHRLGVLKYGLASVAALAALGLALFLGQPVVALLCIPAFYTVEAQMVFLFPLVLDGSLTPFRDARRWTVRAGGTLEVMRIVLPLAATMLFGGFVSQGFVRSWCLGCLAVCLWYERVRRNQPEAQLAHQRRDG